MRHSSSRGRSAHSMRSTWRPPSRSCATTLSSTPTTIARSTRRVPRPRRRLAGVSPPEQSKGGRRERGVAAFDFDGTLSSRDNFAPFLRRVAGSAAVARAMAVNTARVARGPSRRTIARRAQGARAPRSLRGIRRGGTRRDRARLRVRDRAAPPPRRHGAACRLAPHPGPRPRDRLGIARRVPPTGRRAPAPRRRALHGARGRRQRRAHR